VQGITLLDKALFSSYTLRLEDTDMMPPPFSISLVALLETLQIFGIADAGASARNPNGGFSSSYNNAFSAPSLAIGGTCRFSYQEEGAPLAIIIQEGSVTTTCEINTYQVETVYDDDGGIPLDRSKLCLKAIMRSTWLSDAIGELSGTNPTNLIVNASSRSAPFLSLEGEGGPFGDSTVDFTPESKGDPSPSNNRGKKQPLVAETFVVRALTGNHGRLRQRYKFDLIKKAARAMALASKVSVRQDEQGVLSLQFMVDLSDAFASGFRRDDNAAVPSPSSASFVDFRFVPNVDEPDSTASEGQTDEELDEDDNDQEMIV
jgi:cell cycle checkpoint protein